MLLIHAPAATHFLLLLFRVKIGSYATGSLSAPRPNLSLPGGFGVSSVPPGAVFFFFSLFNPEIKGDAAAD